MQLGISSHAYGWAVGVPGHEPEHPMGAFDLLERANALGVRVVQVADNLPLHVLSDGTVEALAARATQLGIAVELGTRGIRPVHIRPYLRLAALVGATLLRTIIDTADHQPGEDEIVRIICCLLPDLEDAGVCLAVENHDRVQVGTMVRVMERIGSTSVGICLDTVNSFGALEGPELVIDMLGPWTVNLHLKDFTIRRLQHRMGFIIEGSPVGQGRLAVPWLLGKLREYGRDPNAIVEQWTPPADSLDATIAQEAAWVEQSVSYGRRFIPD